MSSPFLDEKNLPIENNQMKLKGWTRNHLPLSPPLPVADPANQRHSSLLYKGLSS